MKKKTMTMSLRKIYTEISLFIRPFQEADLTEATLSFIIRNA